MNAHWRDRDQPRSRRCQSVQSELSAYVDGELEGATHVRARCRVEEHVKRCESCAAVLERWALDSLMLAVPKSDVPAAPWFQQQFSKRLAETQAVTLGARLSRMRLTLAPLGPVSESARWFVVRSLPVAVVALGLMLGVGLRVQLESNKPTPALASGFSEFETIALAASGVRQRPSASADGFRFDDVLRPGTGSLALASSGLATPASFTIGTTQGPVVTLIPSEKDR